MKVITYDTNKKASIYAEALAVLLSGGTIVYPTETAYALGADLYSPSAYQRVYTIKKRHDKKSLPVIVPNLKYASTLVQFPGKASQLAMKYWPGPLTLVLPFLYSHDLAYHGDPYLAVRMSSHPIAAALATAFGKPIISTSANISSHPACYTVDELMEQLYNHDHTPDLVIDAGALPVKPVSTIVKITPEEAIIIRKGLIDVTSDL